MVECMSKARILEFDSNDRLIGCSTGWSEDDEGNRGVWCTCENGKKYFIRKGESVLKARQRNEKPNIIDLPDEQIPWSIGAMWVNEEIAMPDGTTAKFVEKSKIINKQVFAGNGTKKPIRDIERLIRKYPTSKAENWQKVKGVAELDWEGEIIKAEIHWYEEPTIGRVETKYKNDI